MKGERDYIRGAVVGVIAIAALLLFASEARAEGVPWEAPIPDYTLPSLPSIAPSLIDFCAPGAKLYTVGDTAKCVGMLENPSDYQYLLDAEVQLLPTRSLVTDCSAGRAGDRKWADEHYEAAAQDLTRQKAATARAKKKGVESFFAGLGVGGAIVGGVLVGVVVAVATR